MRSRAILIVAVGACVPAASADAPRGGADWILGTWRTERGELTIEVTRDEEGCYASTIVSVSPDLAARARAMVGSRRPYFIGLRYDAAADRYVKGRSAASFPGVPSLDVEADKTCADGMTVTIKIREASRGVSWVRVRSGQEAGS